MNKIKAIIVINAGSSSLKFKLFNEKDLNDIVFGQITGIGTEKTKVVIKDSTTKEAIQEKIIPSNTTRKQIVVNLLTDLHSLYPHVEIVSAGHRVVHGGTQYTNPIVINDGVIKGLKSIEYLSPIHLPHNIAPMEILLEETKDLKQVACFDTAFHASNPMYTRYYGIPRKLANEDNIIKYGFHGLSYEYISEKIKEIDESLYSGNVIVCHLGAGASICAIKNGKSLTTSMGFTPLDGLIMGSRCGSIDPGIILYLLQNKKYTPKEIEDLLYYKSGILGLSEISSDFYTLEISKETQAKEALEIFCYNLAKQIGGFIVALGGIDGIVFTAGVGENASDIREYIANSLGFLGAKIDNNANLNKDLVFSTNDSKIKFFTIPTNEELIIAKHTSLLLK